MTPNALRHRAAAAALLASLLTFDTAGAQTVQPRNRWETQARDLLKELVEINTTQSGGNSIAAAEAMAKRMRDAGFPSEDVIVLPNAEKKGNLIVRYRGRDRNKKPILLLSHLDVVEPDPKDWTLPPF